MKFWLTFIAALVSTTAVFARETRVRSIDIDVTFYADGRARFDEKWDVEVGDDFTELYLPKENLGAVFHEKGMVEGILVRDHLIGTLLIGGKLSDKVKDHSGLVSPCRADSEFAHFAQS